MGFPKGRRNKQEENLTCAKREFEEESDYKDTDYIILDNINPIVEDFIGTNGVKYRHIYYLALNNKDINTIKINHNNEHQHNEVGDIKFFNYEEGIKIIRPYHTAKKKVLTMVYMFIIEFIIKNFNIS